MPPGPSLGRPPPTLLIVIATTQLTERLLEGSRACPCPGHILLTSL